MGLENSTRHIILDVSVSKYVAVTMKQYDKNVREIIATVTDSGKPYPISFPIKPRIKGKKSDGTFIVKDCTILENGEIKIPVIEQMTVASGISNYELMLFDDTDKVIHTMNFIINVKESVCSDEEITSTNEFASFEEALLKVDEVASVADEVRQLIEGNTYIKTEQKGIPNGVASLDNNGFIPSSQLPSYVDDVLDGTYSKANNQFLDLDGKPYTPESSKIYIDVNTRITYRWSGTVYVEIASSLALGETSETAFAGDRGLALEQLIGEGYREITEEEIDELFI